MLMSRVERPARFHSHIHKEWIVEPRWLWDPYCGGTELDLVCRNKLPDRNDPSLLSKKSLLEDWNLVVAVSVPRRR